MTKNLALGARAALAVAFAFGTATPAAAQPSDAERDRALADTIVAAGANRDASGLVTKPARGGGFEMELGGRFQNVVLGRMGESGEPVVGCVADLEAANLFFGRDLRTGDSFAMSSAKAADEELIAKAQRHGMTVQEFLFYSELAREYAAVQPNSATISILNNDGVLEGFNSTAAPFLPAPGNTGTNLGEQRLRLFEAAAGVWSAFLDSGQTITIRSQFNSLTPCSTAGGVLGSAGGISIFRDFVGAPFTGTWYSEALSNKLRGIDSGANPDINATFNSDVDTGCLGAGSHWYYGVDSTTPAGTLNLFVVLLHEFGHGLGFQSFTNGSTGAFNSGFPDAWSRLLFDQTANAGAGLTWFQMATNAERAASALNNGNLYWDGANVRIASGFLAVGGRQAGTGRVRMYAPTTFSGGSSVSHYDTTATPSLLMEPFITTGLPLTLDLTRQATRDIGWYRDTTNDLVPDTITSVAPSGGAVTIGANTNITWTNNGGFTRNVTIELSTDGGATFPTAIATDVANTGTRAWTVPNTPTATARIRVREHDFVAPLGSSAADFTIGGNTAPTFTPAAAVSVMRGGPNSVGVAVGTVADAQTAAGSLSVTQIAGGTATGVGALSVANSGGAVTATLDATCTANSGTLRFQVSDGSLTGTGDLSINVLANPAPLLSYGNTSVNGGSSVNSSPTSNVDNGSITGYVVQSQGTYTGTVSVNSSGVVSFTNATPIGVHTITIRATDNCGATRDASFQLTVNNSPPSFTPGGPVTRQIGSTAGTTLVGTVSDPQQAAGTLTVAPIAGGTATNIAIGAVTNSGGNVSATVGAACNATAGTVRFQATDSGSLVGTGDVTINLLANSPPAVTYSNRSVVGGSATSFFATTGPSDNGSVTGFAIQGQGGYTGDISVNGSGMVSIADAAPVGVHAITIRAFDNCGTTTDATFQLTVNNSSPSFVPGPTISRQRGSVASSAAIGTASDPQQDAGSLVVTLVGGGTAVGVGATNIVNTDGAVTADVAAQCTSTAGTLRFQVNDGSLNASGDLTVNLTANTAPTIAYASATVGGGAGLTVNPSTLSDNGTATATLLAQGTYTGGIVVAANGSVTITNAAPLGTHTITIRATDNCSLTTDASFQLTVANSAPSFTPGTALSRQQGSAGTSSTVGLVSDAQQAPGSITVTQIAGGTSVGITATSIVNTTGTIAASVAASCTASAGTLRFQANDGSLTGNGDLQVNITANSAPTFAYANASLNGGAGTTVNPSTALADNGTATAALQSQGTYTGGISVAATGVVTITNAAPVGTHTITIRATDNCGATTDASFQLTVNNTPPSFTAGTAVSRQQGSAGSVATVGTASDPQQAAGSLTVTQVAGGTAVGVTASSIVNAGGTITASVAAACTATAGTLRFQASDGSLSGNGDLPVNITANSAPTFAYTNASVNGAAGTTVNPSSALADNGSATAALQSQGTYTGGISVAGNGAVTITNAAPVGVHTITIRATDNCGSTTDASFQLTVSNTAPSLAAGAAISRQRGSAASNATVGTASDPQQAAGSLVVTQIAGGTSTGVTAANIANASGNIAADIGASCTAVAGTLRFQASDGSLTGNGDLQVNLTANTAPTITYANATLNAGGGTTVNPTALSDNGTATAALQSQGTYTGGISVAANGNVTLTGAAPIGTHTITIRATDNCGLTTDGSFQLTVDNSAPTFTAGTAISRQQGSAASSATVGTAADPPQPAGSVTVTQIVGGTAVGVTASGISNTTGTITALVAASCSASAGTLRFQASDGSLTGTGDLQVNITANNAPAIAYANASVNGGSGATVNTSAALTDNGTASAALQSQGTYTGGISVATNGDVTLTSAAPIGTHTITVRATDNCGSTTDASFQLTVNNTAPAFAPGVAVARTQGSPASSATLGTASDPQQGAGTLLVTQVAGGTATGITTSAVANAGGTISASLAASCTATSGTVRFLVSDGALFATGDVQVNVLPNTAPLLGLYAAAFAVEGNGTIAPPVAAPSDNGSVVSLTASAVPPTFTGTLAGDPVTGNITIGNAGPVGTFTINLLATDDCGATSNGNFTLGVVPDALFSDGFE